MKNKLVGGVVVLVIGIALIITGLLHNGTAKCNNTTMTPTDVCIVGGRFLSYEQRRADDLNAGRTQLILGGVIILVGAGAVAWSVRERRRRPPVPPPATP